jgi:predicted metalloprotease with PDZ domain
MRAGFRNGDHVLKLNGSAEGIDDRFDALHVGDRATVELMRDGKVRQVTLVIESYDRPEVKIQELANPSDRQKAILARWSAGQ